MSTDESGARTSHKRNDGDNELSWESDGSVSWSFSASESLARRSRKRTISATAGMNSEVDSMWRAGTTTDTASRKSAVPWGEHPRVGQNVSGIGLHSRKHRVFVLNQCEQEARARLSPKWVCRRHVVVLCGEFRTFLFATLNDGTKPLHRTIASNH